jgi:hypothetical protein
MGVCLTDKPVDEMDARERSLFIDGLTPEGGLFTDVQRAVHPNSNSSWRVSPDPFWMPPSIVQMYEDLGRRLLSFYKAANLLYSQSLRGIQPAWVAGYLDQGKSDEVIGFGRMNRFRQHLPAVIRPDIIPTKDGMIASELDSVPGGIGFTGSLSERYSRLGCDIVGGSSGMVTGFLRMIRSAAATEEPVLGVLISEESAAWRPEMGWLSDRLNAEGLESYVLTPDEIIFTEEGLFAPSSSGLRKIDVLYRFFELFDLRNIPKIDLILYAVRKGLVRITPPLKHYLEEKMMMGLYHHPALRPFWLQQLGEETATALDSLFPKTWILDPSPMPPYGTIPGLTINGRPARSWQELGSLGQKDRELVVKPSGFSENAWGSRGVSIGHDMSEADWGEVLDESLNAFPGSPHILQEFHTGATFSVSYYDFETDSIQKMKGRARIQPYFFVIDDEPVLGGIQATVCPADKKLLHGMVDAVVVPGGVRK